MSDPQFDVRRVVAPAALVYLPVTTSTMDDAASRLGTLPEFSVVMGDDQTAARGRRGTQWHMLPGRALAFTMLVDELPPQLPLAVALAVQQGIQTHTGIRLGIKWPNDLHYEGEKVGGVLVERQGDHYLIGIGLNVNNPQDGLPADFPGTTLEAIAGGELEREELLTAILTSLHTTLLKLRQVGWQKLRAAYQANCITLGKHVLWRPPVGSEVSGTATSLTEEGGLILKLEDGSTKTITSGAIIVVRA